MLNECGDFSMEDKISEDKKVQIKINEHIVDIYLGAKYFVHTNRTDERVHFLLSHKLAEKGFVPVIFTREKEETARAKYPKNSNLYLFNTVLKQPHIFSPKSLDYLVRIVGETRYTNFFVLFDCLDYLLLYNEKKEVFRFAERLYDAVSGRQAVLIFLICLPLFEPRDLALLERFGEVLPLAEE
ncbi:MAG: DUF835 domain-containing protein [Thermoplasmata archaeon]|nr:DUF835 domain-containing protein [Thermoplasmata archaeon]